MLRSAAHVVLSSPKPIRPVVAYRLARTYSNSRMRRNTPPGGLVEVAVYRALRELVHLPSGADGPSAQKGGDRSDKVLLVVVLY